MNTLFQIQIAVHNWEGGNHVISKEISLNDIRRFTNLISAINNNSGKKTWNWFGKDKGLPDKWDGKRYILDTWKLCNIMNDNFNYKVEDINLVKEFFLCFTPNGADHISNIKIFKVKEIEIK